MIKIAQSHYCNAVLSEQGVIIRLDADDHCEELRIVCNMKPSHEDFAASCEPMTQAVWTLKVLFIHYIYEE